MEEAEQQRVAESLVEAMKAGDVKAVRKLLEEHPDLVHGPDWTPPPLHCAVLWDQPDIIDVLLDAGADIEQRDPDRATTPLRYAIIYAQPNAVRRLIERGAGTGATTAEGTTALELAMNAGDFDRDSPETRERDKCRRWYY